MVGIGRREFIAALGGAAAWPLAAGAQQGDRVRRIGVLMAGDENDPVRRILVSAFTQALAALGWTDGRNMPQALIAALACKRLMRCGAGRRSGVGKSC